MEPLRHGYTNHIWRPGPALARAARIHDRPVPLLLGLCHREDPGGPGEAQWAGRLSATRAWPQ